MEVVKQSIVNVTTRAQWRKWLERNWKSKTEAWLISPKLSSGKKRIPYNDVVEEALCFGWIDSVNKTYDELHTIQRFTPRKKNSPYSQPNIERLRRLAQEKLVHPEILPLIKSLLTEKYSPPEDIIKILKKDKVVWKNFSDFSETYVRVRLAYIDGARNRPEEFKKRLQNFIAKTKENKMIAGYGGVGMYY